MKKYIIIILVTLLCGNATAQNTWNASYFGIMSDGTTDNTGSIQKAIDYISEQGGGSLVFYVGRYLTGTIHLKSNVQIRFSEGVVMVASPNIYAYEDGAMFVADGQQNIHITGDGVIEGSSPALNAFVSEQRQKNHIVDEILPAAFRFVNCKDVSIEGLIMQNAVTETLSIEGGSQFRFERLTVYNQQQPVPVLKVNGSRDVAFANCYFDVAGASVASPGCQCDNLTFANCKLPDGTAVALQGNLQ